MRAIRTFRYGTVPYRTSVNPQLVQNGGDNEGSSASPTTVGLSLPSTTTAGNYLFAFITLIGWGGPPLDSSNWSMPAGWNLIYTNGDGSDYNYAVFGYANAPSITANTTQTFTLTYSGATFWWWGTMLEFSGIGTSAVTLDGAPTMVANESSATSITTTAISGLTGTSDLSFILAGMDNGSSPTGVTASDWTTSVTFNGSGGLGGAVLYQTESSPSSLPDTNVTWSGSNSVQGVLAISLTYVGGGGGGDGGGGDGYTAMSAPSYSGSTWTSGNLSWDESFENLTNWNYGLTDYVTSGGGYDPWGSSNSSPYWGSGGGGYNAEYEFPGNVFQVSTGSNPSLFSSYSPQTFNPSGWGLGLTAHYVGPSSINTQNAGTDDYTWTSGTINTYNKKYFPTSGKTECYWQINAQMASPGDGTVNGSWSALWFMAQTNEGMEIDLTEFGLNVGNTGVSYMNSTIHDAGGGGDAYGTESFNIGTDLSLNYHIYGLEYSPNNYVNFYCDNVLRGSYTSGTMPSWPYFLMIDNTVANSTATEFHSTYSGTGDMTMQIMEVQVYQR